MTAWHDAAVMPSGWRSDRKPILLNQLWAGFFACITLYRNRDFRFIGLRLSGAGLKNVIVFAGIPLRRVGRLRASDNYVMFLVQ